jgi:hypothetical protein
MVTRTPLLEAAVKRASKDDKPNYEIGSKGKVMGTPLFAAPEQIRGEHDPKPNPRVPKIRGGGEHRGRKWGAILSRTGGKPVGQTVCRDAKGNQYTTMRGCAQGHAKITRIEPKPRPRQVGRPAVRKPVAPRTAAAMRSAGTYQVAGS